MAGKSTVSPIRRVICITIPARSYASTYVNKKRRRLKGCKNKKSVVKALDKMAEEMHKGIFYE